MKNLNYKLELLLVIFFFVSMMSAQVGIGTTNPDASAQLEIKATDKGILIPRVALVDVNNTSTPINNPGESLMVYNTNASVTGGDGVGFYFFNGTAWEKIITTASQNTLDKAYDQGGVGAGSTITADNGAVTINGGDGFLVTGTINTGDVITLSGAGARMFFNPKKGAFRAGNINDLGTNGNTVWNNDNVGKYSFAGGLNTLASGTASTAFGAITKATGDYSCAIGSGNIANGNSSMTMGAGNTASGDHSTAMGFVTTASGDYSTAMGTNTSATGGSSTAMGKNTAATGGSSTTMGFYTVAPSDRETVIGSCNTEYTPLSTTAWNNADRLFVIGNGEDYLHKSNALTIYKNGLMNINDAYNMPLADGTANQIMATDGAGVVSFVNPSTVFTDTDNQTIDQFNLIGTTLNLSLEDDGVATQTVDLSSLQDGTGTDNQTIDTFKFTSGTNLLSLEIENDGISPQTVDLSSLNQTASNGLNMTASGIIKLGGALVENTLLTLNTKNLIYNLNSTGNIRIQDNGTNKFEFLNNGDTVLGGSMYFRDGDTSGDIVARVTNTTNSGILNLYNSGGVTTEIKGNGYTYFNGGNVGIGTTTPGYKLSVTGTVNLNEDISQGVALRVNGDEALWYNGSKFSWGDGGTTNYFANKVGIGVNPIYTLDVRSFNANGYAARIYNYTSNSNNTPSALKIRIGDPNPSSATKYIGFYAGATTTFFKGSIRSTSNGNGVLYTTASDRRLKTNIVDIQNALALINKIQPRKYEYKANRGSEEYGFIAQELQKVYPQAVSGNSKSNVETDPMMVDYGRLTPILAAGIKELNKKIQQLEAENLQLKERLIKLDELENRINAIEKK